MFTKTPAGERARSHQTLLIDSLSISYLFLARHQLDGRKEQDAIWRVRDDYYARQLLQSHSDSWGLPFNLRTLYCQIKGNPALLHLKSDQALLKELTDLIANGDVLVFQEANYLVDKQDPSACRPQPMAGSNQSKTLKRTKTSTPNTSNAGPGVTQPTSQGGKAAPSVVSDVPWENQIWSDTSIAEKLLVSVGWGFSEVSGLLQDVAAWESDTSATFDQIGADPSTPEPIRFAAATLKLPARIGTGLVSGVAGLGDLIINPDTRQNLKDGVVKLYQDPKLRAKIAQDFVNQPPHEIASDVLVIAADIAMGGKGAAKLGAKVDKVTPDITSLKRKTKEPIVEPTSPNDSVRITPTGLGVKSLSENQKLLEMWTDSIKHLSTAETKAGGNYRAYLQAMENGNISKDVARKAYEEVAVQFRRRLKAAKAEGIEFADYNFERIHHWNWPIGQFPEDATNASKLYPVSHSQHMDIHRAATIGPHPTNSPIDPANVLSAPSATVLPDNYFD